MLESGKFHEVIINLFMYLLALSVVQYYILRQFLERLPKPVATNPSEAIREPNNAVVVSYISRLQGNTNTTLYVLLILITNPL